MTNRIPLREALWAGFALLTTGATIMWSAILFGAHIWGSDSGLGWGLGLHRVAVMIISLTLIVGLFVGPMAIRRRWTVGERFESCLLVLAWITACVFSTVVVLRSNPFGLPGWPSEFSLGDYGTIAVGVCIFLVVLIMSTVPAALLQADDLRPRGTADSIQTPPRATRATPSTDRLWAVLEELFKCPPGPIDTKTRVLIDGTIATSQGALADRLDTSKGSIHRGLAELEDLGRIRVETNPRETLIRRAPPGGTVVSLLPGRSRRPGTLERP